MSISKKAMIFFSIIMFGLVSNAFCRDKIVLGNFAEWAVYGRNYHVMDIPADKLTHINYAFAKVTSDGEIEVWDTYAALEKHYPETDSWDVDEIRGNFKQLRLLKEAHPHLKLLVALGGWTGSQYFSDISGTEEGRIRFAESAKRFLEAYPIFDGFDIDWEFPVLDGLTPGRPEDRENFSLLLAQLRATLGPDRLISAAVNAGPNGIAAIDFREVAKYVDWIGLMTYDFHGTWDPTTGYNAALYNNNDLLQPQANMDAAVRNLMDAGVPPEMILPGIPFYGRSYAGVQAPGINQPFTGAGPGTYESGFLDYKDIQQNYAGKDGYEYYWDDIAGVPYLYNDAKEEFVSYDDARSIAGKAAYVAENGLGGVMIWELSSDNGDLVQAVHDGFGNPAPPPPEPAPEPDPEPAPEPDPEPAPGGDANFDLRITSAWSTGYCADVTVTNPHTQTIAWEITFELDGSLSSLWSAEYHVSGNTVTATGVSWNRELAPQGSTSFGFCATRSENPPPPAPDPEPEPEPEPDPEPDPDPVLETAVSVTSDWGSGYCANIDITNNGASNSEWTVTVPIEGNVSSLWNATWVQEGELLTVEGVSWNRTLAPGGSVQVGYCAVR